MPPHATVATIEPDERVWVTGDVHLAPGDPDRSAFFLEFLAEARRSADRLVVFGDLFDYWVGPRFARSCAYRPVVEAFEEAAADGFPVDFLAGNRDFMGPGELAAIGLRVHGDAIVYDRAGARTVVTHGDLLVEGDHVYQRYRRIVRSAPIRLLYWLVPEAVRVWVARRMRGISTRRLAKVEPSRFPIDLPKAWSWLERYEAQELLMGHLHREEHHEKDGLTTRMLPGWGARRGPHFVLGPAAELRTFEV